MNISSLLICLDPARAEQARAQIEQLPGVEVHAATAEGLLIVTVEQGDDLEMSRTFEQARAIPGVRLTTLVYHHSETLDDEPPAQGKSTP
ncbi:MAG: hypothetical protein A3I61_08610 [Acidobacteria bacterium RIFCSPLOWO2_02_FULL_68_18]|nr:MAG: hypothetical protein A3I61_08610 [Acidobacteria bacterium RIFCSPLOWO2_02_FULL_68_18]OFW49847.1 MAG: hypothetical protein A3G77_01375 [Acidobacteria bacterium RIFCSPLOWO2_12_FULL_68_19]